MGNLQAPKRTYTKKKVDKIEQMEREFNEKLLALDIERQLKEREAEAYRSRTIHAGAHNEGIEISMRLNNGAIAYHIMSPAEAVEFIHSIASRAGCHIAIQPREDFSSYRNWDSYLPYEAKRSDKLLTSGSEFAKLENKEDNVDLLPQSKEDK